MGIKQMPDGTWDAFYAKRHPKTKISVGLRRTKIKSKIEARRIEKQLVLEVDYKIKETVIPKWSEFLPQFLQHVAEHGEISKIYHYTIEKVLTASTAKWNDLLIDEISTDAIRTLVKNDYGAHSVSHQRNILKYLRKAFEYACEMKFVHRSPVPFIKYKKSDKIKAVLTQPQAKQLLEESKRQGWFWYPHYTLALYTGMRNGELYALRWNKVSFESRLIVVDESWNNKDGFKSTKSEDDRNVEIAENLLIVLSELKLQTFHTGFVLPRHRQWDKGEQARELAKFLESINLPKIRFHDLRATWATLMLSRGVPAVQVMVMGGWKDLKTMQIYLRKAGVDIKGMTAGFDLHNPHDNSGKILNFPAKVVECNL